MIDLLDPLLGLFVLSFAAATILPIGSEVGLLAMAALSPYTTLTLLAVASAGNILGSVLNFALGRLALHFQEKHWIELPQTAMDKAQKWFARWGDGAVLLAWVPIIGDPITVAAGAMGMSFWRFFLLVSLSKTARYIVVLGLFDLTV